MPRQIAIRLGTEGRAQVVADLDAIGSTGDAAFNRLARSAVKAGRDADAAMEFANRQASKLAALLPGLNPTKLDMAAGVRYTVGKSAESSAAVFEAAYAKMEARATALRTAIDPVFGAQQRFNREMAEARTLISAGEISLDEYVAKLRQERAALDAVSGGHAVYSKSANAVRGAMQGVSYQVQDTFTQLSMGANVFQVVAIQGGQLAGQFSNLEGRAGDFARFMMGPWGLGITAGLLVLGPLVGKLIDFSDAMEDAIDKLKKDAKESEATARAKDRFAASIDGVEASIRDQRKALDDSIASEKSAGERARDLAKANMEKAIAIRTATAALLSQAIVQEEADRTRSQGPGQRGELGTLSLTESSGRVAGLQARLAREEAAIEAQRRLLLGTGVTLAREAAERESDPIGKIKAAYKAKADAAIDAARKATAAGKDVQASLQAQLTKINQTRDAAVQAEQDKQKASRETAKADRETVTSSQVAKILRSELPGVHVTSTTGGKHVKNSYHYRNQAVDFVPAGGMDSMTKADVRKIFTARGIDVVELLGPGDKGHSDHFHVAWTKGKNSLDEFNDAAKRNKEAQRELAKANREMDSDLADVVSQFDPARAAADDYAKTLAKIATLQGAGRLNLAEAADYRLAALHKDQARQAEERLAQFRTLFGNDDPLASILNEGQIGREAWWNEYQERQDRQREGVRDLAGYYRDMMRGGTSSFLDLMRDRGMQILSELLAKWTIGKSGDGAGGILGAIGSLFGKSAPAGSALLAAPNLGGAPSAMGSSGLPKLASGTEYWSGGTALLGEHGPERAWLPQGTRVTPAGQTMRESANDNGGARSFHFDLRGAIVTQDILDQMNAIGSNAAMQGAAGGAAMSQAESQRGAARKLGRGWR